MWVVYGICLSEQDYWLTSDVSTIAPGNCDVYATHEAFDDFDVHDVHNSHDDYSCDVPYRLQINGTVVKIWQCKG